MKFKEIETKYSADEITFDNFMKIINSLPITKSKMVSSFDDYFVNGDGDFVRYRYTDETGELTIKRKTSKTNNNERVEINVPTSGNNLNTIQAFVGLLGYKHNFGIYKTCKIFWLDKVDLVYYVVYDKEFKELRRFIEIEALEDHPWESEQQAWDEVVKYEKILEPLGITPQHRMKRSLFEQFRREPSV
jgi:adenylate cyclase class IV